MGGMGGMHGMHDMHGMGGMPRGPRQDPPITTNLPISLEDLYKGCVKKLKVGRTVYDDSGRGKREDELLQVDIKPGYKKGTKITFPQKGVWGGHAWHRVVDLRLKEEMQGVHKASCMLASKLSRTRWQFSRTLAGDCRRSILQPGCWSMWALSFVHDAQQDKVALASCTKDSAWLE
jgi:hypothetical protein